MIRLRNFVRMLLHQPLFIVILFAMPILSVLVSLHASYQDTHIQVGFYIDQAEEHAIPDSDKILMQKFVSNLSEYPGDITFLEYTDLDKMIRDCSSERLECAYRIPGDIASSFDLGHISNQIQLYLNHSTQTEQVINMALYSCFFHEYALRLLDHYIDENTPEDFPEYSLNELSDIFYTHAGSGETFAFDYYNKQNITVTHSDSLMKHAVIGLLPLLCLLACLCAYFYYNKLSSMGTFSKMVYRDRFPFYLSYITTVTIPLLLLHIIAQSILNDGFHIRILLSNGLLFIILMLFMIFCYKIHATKKGLLSVIPLYLLYCIVLSPMIYDFSSVSPIVRTLSYLCINRLFY